MKVNPPSKVASLRSTARFCLIRQMSLITHQELLRQTARPVYSISDRIEDVSSNELADELMQLQNLQRRG